MTELFEAHFTGLPEYRQTVDQLDRRVKQRMLKDAQKRACGVVTASIRALTPRESGALDLAIASKTRISASGAAVYSAIGVNRKFVIQVASQMRTLLPRGQLAVAGAVARLRSGESAAGQRNRRPSKYYFNVEKGHEGLHGPAQAHPFIAPGWEAAKAQVQIIMETYARQAVTPPFSGGSADNGGFGDESGGAAALGASLREKAVARLNRAVGYKRPTRRDRRQVLATWSRASAADRRAVQKTWKT